MSSTAHSLTATSLHPRGRSLEMISRPFRHGWETVECSGLHLHVVVGDPCRLPFDAGLHLHVVVDGAMHSKSDAGWYDANLDREMRLKSDARFAMTILASNKIRDRTMVKFCIGTWRRSCHQSVLRVIVTSPLEDGIHAGSIGDSSIFQSPRLGS